MSMAGQIAPVAGAKASAATALSTHPLIRNIAWHWETYKTAAPGSDLWPMTWGPDDHLYTAWGDGGGFGGTDSEGRVSLGFARIEGSPTNFRGMNINGGKSPQHVASFPIKGKTAGLAFVDGVLYASINLQDGPWPHVNHLLAWSTDRGRHGPRLIGSFPRALVVFSPPGSCSSARTTPAFPPRWLDMSTYLGPKRKPSERAAIRSTWRGCPGYRFASATPISIFRDWMRPATPPGPPSSLSPSRSSPMAMATASGMVFNSALKRYFLTSYHDGPGQLGLFDAQIPGDPGQPWPTTSNGAK